MLKLKLQYFGHLMLRVDSLGKTDAGRDWGQEEKGMTEDEMAGWHHRLDGHQASSWVGPGKPNLPLGLRGKAGGGARVTAHSSFEGELGIALESLQEKRDLI